MSPKVSIIIPCYNDADYVEESVKSAYELTYRNKEIIVVDDGSDQQTKAVLKKLDSKIDKLISQDNVGVVSARNSAIGLAQGEYILTLDSDDYFAPQFLEKSVKILEEKKNVGMVTCWTTKIDETGNKIGHFKPSGASASKAVFYNNAPGNLLYRKVCWEDVGGYDIEMKNGNEDWEFNVAVCKKGYKVHVIKEFLFFYRVKTLSRNKTALKHRKTTRQYAFKKHQDLLINNIETTIDFFLEEIEMKENKIRKMENSRAYKFGNFVLNTLRKLKP